MNSAKKIEFKRNKEFDRPYLDSHDEKERFATEQISKCRKVNEYFKCVAEGKCSDTDTVTLSEKNSVKTLLSRDNVSLFFSYPEFERTRTTSSDAYRSHSVPSRPSLQHGKRRNEYSEYTEQIIKFGLRL
jgi:hypothetical protein